MQIHCLKIVKDQKFCLITLIFLGPLNSVKEEVLIPLNTIVSPFTISCGTLVIPIMLFLSLQVQYW